MLVSSSGSYKEVPNLLCHGQPAKKTPHRPYKTAKHGERAYNIGLVGVGIEFCASARFCSSCSASSRSCFSCGGLVDEEPVSSGKARSAVFDTTGRPLLALSNMSMPASLSPSESGSSSYGKQVSGKEEEAGAWIVGRVCAGWSSSRCLPRPRSCPWVDMASSLEVVAGRTCTEAGVSAGGGPPAPRSEGLSMPGG